MGIPIFSLAFGLTDLLETEAFRGSLGIIQKFQWVGVAMQWIISLFSLLGLFLVCYQIFVTLLYFSSRTTFDMIYDLKKGSSGGFLGLKGVFDDLRTGAKATGVDAVITFLLSLAPNVKAYSYYNPERMNSKLSEDDSCLTFILKIAPSTICMIFFLTIGWNGLLFQAFGTVVDGLSYVADNVIDIQFTNYIDRLMQAGSAYNFSFSVDNSKLGELRLSMAKKIRSKVLRKITDISEPIQQTVGSNVETWVTNNITYESLQKFGCKASESVDRATGEVTIENEYDVGNIDFSVVVNASADGTSDDFTIPFSALGLREVGITEEQYVHIGISRDQSALEKDIYTVKE